MLRNWPGLPITNHQCKSEELLASLQGFLLRFWGWMVYIAAMTFAISGGCLFDLVAFLPSFVELLQTKTYLACLRWLTPQNMIERISAFSGFCCYRPCCYVVVVAVVGDTIVAADRVPCSSTCLFFLWMGYLSPCCSWILFRGKSLLTPNRNPTHNRHYLVGIFVLTIG